MSLKYYILILCGLGWGGGEKISWLLFFLYLWITSISELFSTNAMPVIMKSGTKDLGGGGLRKCLYIARNSHGDSLPGQYVAPTPAVTSKKSSPFKFLLGKLIAAKRCTEGAEPS